MISFSFNKLLLLSLLSLKTLFWFAFWMNYKSLPYLNAQTTHFRSSFWTCYMRNTHDFSGSRASHYFYKPHEHRYHSTVEMVRSFSCSASILAYLSLQYSSFCSLKHIWHAHTFCLPGLSGWVCSENLRLAVAKLVLLKLCCIQIIGKSESGNERKPHKYDWFRLPWLIYTSYFECYFLH